MPSKIRELIRELEGAGFVNRREKVITEILDTQKVYA
jgi:hypothetical protein